MTNSLSVGLGELVISHDPEDVLVAYGLGSCVGIAMYNPVTKTGGLLHAVLPERFDGGNDSPTKFVNTGIPVLLEKIKSNGSNNNILLYMAGGANMLINTQLSKTFDIGTRNVASALQIFEKMNLKLRNSELGRQHRPNSSFIYRFRAHDSQSHRWIRKKSYEKNKGVTRMTQILIVDDAEFLRVRISKMLVGEGFEVSEAENGLKAIESYKTKKPDMVLMDVTMPEMDGLTALKELRKIDPNAKVVMLTALGQESVVLEAVKSGAKDFIVKPFDRDRVMSAINKLLGIGNQLK